MIDQYKAAFQEEAREILLELESSLLELNENRDDKELVGRVFRALHTIKGSGAMFGFEDVASFTHHVENAFDEVRNGRLAASPDLISIALAAVDQIKAMLDEAAGQKPADKEVSAQILAKLVLLIGLGKEKAGETTQAATTGRKQAEETPLVQDEGSGSSTGRVIGDGALVANQGGAIDLEGEGRAGWQIHFAPGSDLIRKGTNPLFLLRELRDLGNLTVRANPALIPGLQEIDPERCYLVWKLTLESTASADAISDVFMFVEDCCELTITKIEARAGALAKGAGAPLSVQPPGEQGAGVQAASEAPATAPQTNSPAADGSRSATAATAGSPGPGATERRAGSARRSADKDPAASIRVAAGKLDQLVDLVGQLVTVQARLGELAARSEDHDMQAVVEEVEALTSELRENSMSMRTLPLRSTFERLKRLVYDLGRSLHKEVELTFEGGDTDLDKTVIDQLNDPMMHLIRNCMDHGIESSEARRAAGKPAIATVHLAARHAGAQVLISVSDDGKGIDAEAVRARAVEKGLIASDARLTEAEVFALILAPGFSTAKEITDVSGRGVGMDVVRRNVEALRGSIEIASEPGRGSTVSLRLPLTLAIIDGLLVRVGEARFVMPLANTTECVELTQEDIDNASGKHLANIRGEIIPYIRLSEYLQSRGGRPEREQVMVAETEHGRFGFVVDQVLGDHQTVIKSLGRLYRNVQIISGATILGDGTVALILDLHRMAQDVMRTTAEDPLTRDQGAQVGAWMKEDLARRAANGAAQIAG